MKPKEEWNAWGSAKSDQINHDNLNKPMSKLVCPRCEGTNIQRDDGSEHPGAFECIDCGEMLLA